MSSRRCFLNNVTNCYVNSIHFLQLHTECGSVRSALWKSPDESCQFYAQVTDNTFYYFSWKEFETEFGLITMLELNTKTKVIWFISTAASRTEYKYSVVYTIWLGVIRVFKLVITFIILNFFFGLYKTSLTTPGASFCLLFCFLFFQKKWLRLRPFKRCRQRSSVLTWLPMKNAFHY